MERTPKLITALSAVAETTASAGIDITDAKKVTLIFTRASHGSGNHVFTVTGSINGISGTYVACNKLIKNIANAISEGITRVASITLSANGSELVSLDLEHDGFTHIKITATETTDGTATASVLVQY